MREMIVSGISVDPDSKSPVMILRDKAGGRILPIWIGPVEAGSISVAINRVPMPRPLTHDLMLTVLHSLNATLTAARITEVRNGTFYAEIDLKAHGVPLTIDCRPSDAVALALRGGAPIYVKEEVLVEAGQTVDENYAPDLVHIDFEFAAEPEEEPELIPEEQPDEGRTVVLSQSETEDFMAKLLRALEPETKYKM